MKRNKERTYGPAYEQRADGARLSTQIEIIRAIMLHATQCCAWLTLREIELLTRFPQASISAQLRHLRKPSFGGWTVLKRRRGAPSAGVWEYRVLPPHVGVRPPQIHMLPPSSAEASPPPDDAHEGGENDAEEPARAAILVAG